MGKFSDSTITICTDALKKSMDEISSLPMINISELPTDRSCLIIVDAVNGFIREGAMSDRQIESIIPPITELMKKCKSANIPIIAFADCHSKDCAEFASFPSHCVDGTHEAEIVDEIKTEGGYTLIKKNSTNGYHESDFIKYLQENPDTDTFIVVGDCTDICVMQLCLAIKTGFTAQNKNVNIIVPANCVETYDAPAHGSDFANIAAYTLMSGSGIKFVSEIA